MPQSSRFTHGRTYCNLLWEVKLETPSACGLVGALSDAPENTTAVACAMLSS
jgi:hypothetical protein